MAYKVWEETWDADAEKGLVIEEFGAAPVFQYTSTEEDAEVRQARLNMVRAAPEAFQALMAAFELRLAAVKLSEPESVTAEDKAFIRGLNDKFERLLEQALTRAGIQPGSG